MRYIVAVSGGVDSVVLLHMLAERENDELVVAHFDHGIRPDSADDAVFVSELAKKYKLPFETRREELGSGASEELARARRYAFLREVAVRHEATIVTAHHADDVVETIAINLIRGTGWRGLAVLDSDIHRPLLSMTKAEIVVYAQEHDVQWREDSTNQSDAYLRNIVRRKLHAMPGDNVWQLAALRSAQTELKQAIDIEVAKFISATGPYSRYFFTQLEPAIGVECVRTVTEAQLTRPQCERLLLAIKTIRPGKVYQASKGVSVHFTARHFTLEVIK